MNAYFKVTKRKADAQAGPLNGKYCKQDGQRALVKSEVKVPLDHSFPIATGKEKVHIDKDGMIYDATLNQADIDKNANKFYRIQVVQVDTDEYRFHTRWGRVGSLGQSKTSSNIEDWEAMGEFEAKFLSKTGLSWSDRDHPPKKGKYMFLQKSYVQDECPDNYNADLEIIADLPGRSGAGQPTKFIPFATSQLIDLIFEGKFIDNALEKIGYNQANTPIGKLSKKTIMKGYMILSELDKLIANATNSSEHDMIEASNRYYSMIPHVSNSRTRLPTIKTKDLLIHEVKMLDNLSQLEITARIKRDGPQGSRLDQLRLEKVTPLSHHSDEFTALSQYLENTSGIHHTINYKIREIFSIRREGEAARFQASKFANLGPSQSDRRLLWHGSRTANFGGILSQGLRIAPPEVPANGYAFGKGVYFADCSTKSANYCHASYSGNQALLLLCEVELGKPMKDVEWGHSGDPRDHEMYLSTHGIGSYGPSKWVDAGKFVNENLAGVIMPDPSLCLELRDGHSLRYDEYIVYSEAQVQIRYLFHVEM